MKIALNKNLVIVLLGCAVLLSIRSSIIKPVIPYKNPKLPTETRVADLLKRMTVEEKIRQLDMFWGKEVSEVPDHEATAYSESKIRAMLGTLGAGSVHDFYPLTAEIANQVQQYAVEKTRLGIPILFIEEGLHGYSGKGSTSFPIPMQLASSWDTALVKQVGRVIATESRAHGTDMILGPVLCLPRDPRWGRVEETYGEDPFLSAANGVAMVKGLQGESLSSNNSVIAEPKHFAVHGIPEAGSNTGPVNIGEREARTDFLYVFEKAVREGHAMAMMAAYSEIDGIPCVDNKWLLTDVLRKEWGFKGFVLSDLGAIKMSLVNHHVAVDTADALAQTFNAGLNMQFYDFGHGSFILAVKKALKSGKLTQAQLDRTVADVLAVKFQLGLFDHPYVQTDLLQKVFHTATSQSLSLKAAQEGICLLKNESNILPLSPTVKSLAVIGSLAESNYLGGYSNKDDKAISILDGLRQRVGGKIQITYEKGYSTVADSTLAMQRAVEAAKQSEVVILVLGEEPGIVGEGKDRAGIDLGAHQLNLAKAVAATGKPVIAVLANGRPLSINWVAEHVPSVVESWFGGEKSGLAIADVLLGNVNPSGKLPMTFPRSIGQVPIYYNHKPTSYHKYVDEKSTPLFPFGHGLSYTTFQYSDLQLVNDNIRTTGAASIKVKITNTGNRAGTEVAQLYIRDIVSSVTTPVMALKGFQRVNLQPGKDAVVTFRLPASELALWNRQMKRVVEPGDFEIMIGSSSADIRLKSMLHVSGR